MIAERFVLDESSLMFRAAGADAVEASLSRFVALLEYALATGAGVVRWSEIWYVEAVDGTTLGDLLYASREIDRDIRLLAGGRIDKIRCWDDADDVNPEATANAGGVIIDLAPSIGLSVLAALAGRRVACLGLDQAERRGPLATEAPPGAAPVEVFFLVDPSDAPAFWRNVVEFEDMQAAALAQVAGLAFPELVFAPETTWDQIGRFEGAYKDIRAQLVRDLGGLSDHAAKVWAAYDETARRSAEMASRAGVECSIESTNTHKNKAAMAERDVKFGDRIVTCEWHTKLEPNRNRVHFAVMEEDVLVGIFVDHLTI